MVRCREQSSKSNVHGSSGRQAEGCQDVTEAVFHGLPPRELRKGFPLSIISWQLTIDATFRYPPVFTQHRALKPCLSELLGSMPCLHHGTHTALRIRHAIGWSNLIACSSANCSIKAQHVLPHLFTLPTPASATCGRIADRKLRLVLSLSLFWSCMCSA